MSPVRERRVKVSLRLNSTRTMVSMSSFLQKLRKKCAESIRNTVEPAYNGRIWTIKLSLDHNRDPIHVLLAKHNYIKFGMMSSKETLPYLFFSCELL